MSIILVMFQILNPAEIRGWPVNRTLTSCFFKTATQHAQTQAVALLRGVQCAARLLVSIPTLHPNQAKPVAPALSARP